MILLCYSKLLLNYKLVNDQSTFSDVFGMVKALECEFCCVLVPVVIYNPLVNNIMGLTAMFQVTYEYIRSVLSSFKRSCSRSPHFFTSDKFCLNTISSNIF